MAVTLPWRRRTSGVSAIVRNDRNVGRLSYHCINMSTVSEVTGFAAVGDAKPLLNGSVPIIEFVLDRKYFRYLHQTNPIVFTMIVAVKQTKFEVSNNIITKVCLLGYIIYL